MGHPARYWVGGLCDKRHIRDLCQIRMDVVLGKLKKEEMEIAKLSLRNIDERNRRFSRRWMLLGLHLRLYR